MEITLEIQQALGHYECRNQSSSKFWQVKYAKGNYFDVSWGKIGYGAQGTNSIDAPEVMKKVKEKLKKGYVKCAHLNLDNYHEKLMLEWEMERNQQVAALAAPQAVSAKKYKI